MLPSERSVLVTYVCSACHSGWWNDTGADRCRLCGNLGEIRGRTLQIDVRARSLPGPRPRKTLTVESPPFRARHDAGCGGCDLPILAGQRNVRLSNGTYRHETCAEPGMLT